MFGRNKKKTSFIERLTGSVHPDDFDDDFEIEDELEEVEESESSLEDLESDGEGQLSVDVFNTPEDIVIKAMVAGVRPGDLDIDITRDMVTIHGERMEESEITEENYYHKELYWGSFSRNILLPEEVDVEEASAQEKNGLLVISLPKLDKNKKTKLHVKSK